VFYEVGMLDQFVVANKCVEVGGRLTELFATHPTLAHRAHAIANDGRIPADRLTDILKEAGIPQNA